MFINIPTDETVHDAVWEAGTQHVTIKGGSFRASLVTIKSDRTAEDLIIEDCTILGGNVTVGGRLFVKNCHIMDGVQFRPTQQFHLISNLISARSPIVTADKIADFCFFCQNHLWKWDGGGDDSKDAFKILDLEHVDGLNVSNNSFYRRSIELRGGWIKLASNMFDSVCTNRLICDVHSFGNLYQLDGRNKVTEPFLNIDGGGQLNMIGDRCMVSNYNAKHPLVITPRIGYIWSSHFHVRPIEGIQVTAEMIDCVKNW